jgi:hypothetical protein
MKRGLQPPKHKAHRKGGINVSNLSRETGIPRKTLNEWIAAGMPTDSPGAAMRWMIANRPTYFAIEGTQDQSQWTKADWDKFKTRWQALSAQHEYERQTGEVHGKAECCKSVTSIVSEHLQPLLSVGSRLAAQRPEVPRLKEDADKEIDAAMAQIRGGLEK